MEDMRLDKSEDGGFIRLRESENYEELKRLFIENGLEFDEDEERPDVVKLWSLEDGEKLIGGACLSLREGEFCLDGIAVDGAYRGRKLGEKLMEKIMAEVRERGGKRLVLVARVPEFYRKLGFKTVADEASPVHFDCIGCPQNGISCFPEVMIGEIRDENIA